MRPEPTGAKPLTIPSLFIVPFHTITVLSQVEIPNIQKQRKHLAKLVLDMDSARTRWVWETPSPVNRRVLRLLTERCWDLIAHSGGVIMCVWACQRSSHYSLLPECERRFINTLISCVFFLKGDAKDIYYFQIQPSVTQSISSSNFLKQPTTEVLSKHWSIICSTRKAYSIF